MKAKKTLRTVEVHTTGQPTRCLTSGFAHIPGNTMTEKMYYMQENEDWVRTILTMEPRGHESQSGCMITEPCTPGTDAGILYFESAGWLPMCGCDTIAVSTVLIETGLVKVTEPVTRLKLDTPAGVIEIEAQVENGTVKEASFVNAPAFVVKENITVQTKEFGPLTMDVAWGGNLYGILPAESVGIPIEKQNASLLVAAAQSIAADVNRQFDFTHPELPFIGQLTHVEFYGEPKGEGADVQNCVIALPKTVDRSPCGTGTSAKSAVLHRQGKLKAGESFVHESIIGSTFRCEIVAETEVAGFPAVVPKVSGRAWLSGFATWIIDPEDPFQEGFLLA